MPVTTNVLVIGRVRCSKEKKGIAGVNVDVTFIEKDRIKVKGTDVFKTITNAKGQWAATFQLVDMPLPFGVKVEAVCPGQVDKKLVKIYKGAGFRKFPLQSVIETLKKIKYLIKDNNPLKERLKLIANVNLNYKLTGSDIECCPKKINKEKAEDAGFEEGFSEQIALQLGGVAAADGVLTLELGGVELIVPVAENEDAGTVLRNVGEELSSVAVRLVQPFETASGVARLTILSGADGRPSNGARLDLDAGTALKVSEFAAECYEPDTVLLGDASASVFIGMGAETVVVALRERTTETRHQVAIPVAPMDSLGERVLAALPVDDAVVAQAKGGVVLTVTSRSPETLLVEGAAVHGSGRQILSIGEDPSPVDDLLVADDPVSVIDGIGPATQTALADVGIRTLTDLVGASPETLSAAGLTEEDAREFRAMADILIANPTLNGDDAEVAVNGLGLVGARELADRLAELTETQVAAAAATVRTPAAWSTERLMALKPGAP